MTFLLKLIGLAPPPRADSAAVIRGFVSVLGRLDATAPVPPEDVQ